MQQMQSGEVVLLFQGQAKVLNAANGQLLLHCEDDVLADTESAVTQGGLSWLTTPQKGSTCAAGFTMNSGRVPASHTLNHYSLHHQHPGGGHSMTSCSYTTWNVEITSGASVPSSLPRFVLSLEFPVCTDSCFPD